MFRYRSAYRHWHKYQCGHGYGHRTSIRTKNIDTGSSIQEQRIYTDTNTYTDTSIDTKYETRIRIPETRVTNPTLLKKNFVLEIQRKWVGVTRSKVISQEIKKLRDKGQRVNLNNSKVYTETRRANYQGDNMLKGKELEVSRVPSPDTSLILTSTAIMLNASHRASAFLSLGGFSLGL